MSPTGFLRGEGNIAAVISKNYGSIAANTTADLTFALPGAIIGDCVSAAPSTTIETGLTWSSWVSAADVVTIRLANSTVGAIDPAAVAWRCEVLSTPL